ncbi:hypothetical protein E8E13_006337 [Curvularia kusanoi]|uniref:Heterokaryon incompatibility domain-containing protein n=1 Tax=Curvularia kusanoi TaxID=90978 RepID=A0A9P4T9H7_CURKU|nr:hypothetical protein E8E13_006337 [Curvularia kusanoi]
MKPYDGYDFGLWFDIAHADSQGVPEKHPVAVTFGCLHKEKAEECAMQLSLDPGTRSDRSLGQARTWIDQCCANHYRCAVQTSGSQLPTRLIYVERANDQSISAKLCLRQSIQPDERYLSLSHRWGDSKFLTLTARVLEEWQMSIPVSDLSKVFQDAFLVSAALGFSYIWIDSLCIVQDDQDDWKRESATMHHVYRGATCNLSATDFENSTDGLMTSRRLCYTVPPIVQPVWRPTQEELDAEVTSLETARQRIATLGPDRKYIVTEIDPFIRVFRGPLFYRAWILQEQLLASRTLHFGREQMSWECNKLLANEVWPVGFSIPTVGDKKDMSGGHISQFDLDDLATKENFEIHQAWKNLLNDYLNRDITHPSDRIPALSGLASEFRTMLANDTYRYGLWMRDPSSLLWTPLRDKDAETNIVVGIPSWSWAKYSSQIFWRHDRTSGALGDAIDWTHRTYSYCLDVGAFGTSAHELVLKGPLLLPTSRKIGMTNFYGLFSQNFRYVEHCGGSACLFDLDHLFLKEITVDGELQLPLLHIMPMVKVFWDTWKRDKPVYIAWGLALLREPSLERALYRRVGTATLNSIQDNLTDLLPPLQSDIDEDDYLEQDDGGIYTIVVV